MPNIKLKGIEIHGKLFKGIPKEKGRFHPSRAGYMHSPVFLGITYGCMFVITPVIQYKCPLRKPTLNKERTDLS
jgi:hypothetical protein